MTYQSRADYVEPPPPEFHIISPAPGAVFRPDERFASEVELVLPEGGRLPIFLMGGLGAKRNSRTDYQYLPKRKIDDKTYIYHTDFFFAPRKPGRYQLWCEADYVDNIAGITFDKMEFVEAKFPSKSILVEVKRK